VFIFANGSEFIGSFRNNKFVHGIYTWNNGRVYDGDWDNTLRHGFGRYYWPDDRKYEGEWKRDKRDGHGKYTWANGDQYEGEFCDGKRIGPGVLTLANGQVYHQIWFETQFDEDDRGLNNPRTHSVLILPASKKQKCN